jgi:Mn-dependent DtxR family transcriptional regulator
VLDRTESEQRQRKSSEAVDDYLKAIFSLSGDEQRRVGGMELAERLKVAPASITNMLQRLADEQNPLIDYERGRGVCLSALGRKRALEIVRHHRLIETFLFKVLDYPIDARFRNAHVRDKLLPYLLLQSRLLRATDSPTFASASHWTTVHYGAAVCGLNCRHGERKRNRSRFSIVQHASQPEWIVCDCWVIHPSFCP